MHTSTVVTTQPTPVTPRRGFFATISGVPRNSVIVPVHAHSFALETDLRCLEHRAVISPYDDRERSSRVRRSRSRSVGERRFDFSTSRTRRRRKRCCSHQGATLRLLGIEHERLTMVPANDGHSLRRICGPYGSKHPGRSGNRLLHERFWTTRSVHKFSCYCGAKSAFRV